MPECTICRNPKTPEVLLRVYNNDLSLANAAKELDTSYSMLWHHVRFHDKSPDNPDSQTDALTVLNELTTELRRRFNEMKEFQISPANEKMITTTIDSLRQTLMDTERLSGRLRSAPLIQLQQVTIHYEQLVGFLASAPFCNECRTKVLEFLKEKTAPTPTTV